MRSFAVYLCLILLSGVCCPSKVFGTQIANPGFANLVEKLLPAVVNISTEHKVQSANGRKGFPGFPPGGLFEEFRDFFERFDHSFEFPDQERQVISLGSGFLISKDGNIVTNYHVIANADEVTVTLNNNEHYKAKIVGFDQLSDLALLKIDAKGVDLPCVEIGDSNTARTGDWVIAVGNPFGFGGSVSVGIVSARSRDVRLDSSAPADFIQTDAAINRGNSGGPLFNIEGKVIGIATAIYSPSGGSIGIGFAVPSNDFKMNLQTISSGKKVIRGFLGVKLQEMTDEIVESLGLKKKSGALVAEVVPNSPASEAGVKVGDVITEFAGSKVDKPLHLNKLVHKSKVGSSAELKVMRRIGKKIQHIPLTVTVGKLDDRNKGKSGSTKYEAIGIEVADVTPETRRTYKIQDTTEEGVVVTKSKYRALREGDVILKVGEVNISGTDDFAKAIENEGTLENNVVLFRIKRKGEPMFIGVPLQTQG